MNSVGIRVLRLCNIVRGTSTRHMNLPWVGNCQEALCIGGAIFELSHELALGNYQGPCVERGNTHSLLHEGL